MTKQFTTTQPEPARAAYHAPETFTLKRAKSSALAFAAVLLVVLAAWLGFAQGWAVPAVVVLVLAAYAGVNAFWLSSLTERLIANELPKHPKAKRSGDQWRIHLKREIPVGDRGTVNMEPDTIDLPVAPKEFTRIVRDMMRRGTGIDNRPPGVSQPLRTKILRALEDMDGATNAGPGVGWKLSDDLDALLKDIDQW